MRAIPFRLGYSRSRTCPAFRPLDARTETFVVRIEVKEKIVRVSLVSRLELLQHGFEEPRSVTDVPARRRHELRGLNHIVFDLQWRDDFECARADLLVKFGDRSSSGNCRLFNLCRHDF